MITLAAPPVCQSPRSPLLARRLASLSRAECEVLAYIRQGLSNKEIAVARGRSVATVKNQVSICLGKLGVDSRTRLMALFIG